MKKFLVVSVALALVLGAGIGGAWGYTFPNNTYIEAYKGNSVSNATGLGTPAPANNPPWWDVIGNPQIFETYGANLSGNTLTIFTNWGPEDVPTYGAITADLFIDTNLDGTFDYAVQLSAVLTNGGLGNFNASILGAGVPTTSQDLFAASGLYYGGRYDYATGNLKVPVLGTGSDTGKTAAVTWAAAGNDPDYSIAVNLANVPGFDPTSFAFLWGTGTCANDTAAGKVPLPGALLLLGAGLVRLANYGRRKRNLA